MTSSIHAVKAWRWYMLLLVFAPGSARRHLFSRNENKYGWSSFLQRFLVCPESLHSSVATLLALATSFGDGCCAQNKSVSKSKRLLEHKAHRLDLLLNFFSNAGQQKQKQIQKVVDASRLDLFLNPFPNCQDQAWAWANYWEVNKKWSHQPTLHRSPTKQWQWHLILWKLFD